jgi:hypothetical protein
VVELVVGDEDGAQPPDAELAQGVRRGGPVPERWRAAPIAALIAAATPA